MLAFLEENGEALLYKIGDHLSISMSALLLGCLIAVPLGVIVSRKQRISQIFISITSVLQTIPSLALLAMIVPFFGVGRLPAIIALCIYSLLPILRNTVLGMDGVDKNILDAAKGMGMTYWQRVFRVQLPLAFPVIMAGIRLSCIYVLAWTTLAAYIGAGGLGDYIFAGLNNFNLPMIVAGTVPVTIIALVFDQCLGWVEKRLSPVTQSPTEASV